jgi:hypothetical protein
MTAARCWEVSLAFGQDGAVLRDGLPAPPAVAKVAVAVVLLVALALAVLLAVGGALVAFRAHDARDFRGYFERHQRDFERVAEMVASGQLVAAEGESYYGPYLPADLQYLTKTGRVSIEPDRAFFLPRWTGIPDDAGGYWHNAHSPQGLDMYGMSCADAVDLGGNWWACGMN